MEKKQEEKEGIERYLTVRKIMYGREKGEEDE